MGKTRKSPCKYGSKCYRKSEEHLNGYSHPGDSDDESPPPKEKRRKIGDYFSDDKKSKTEDEASTSKDTKSDNEDTKADNEDAKSGNEDTPEKTNKEETDQKTSENEDEEEHPDSPVDVKENIKSKFLVEMPDDFYDLWEFAKSINPKKPEDAFKNTVGLQLVGPYDVLADKCVKKNSKGQRPCYLRHWRYFYDPPEFLTVLKGDDKSQFHMGYFRDDPKEMPVFMASNAAKENYAISQRGENIYAAINWYIDDQVKKDKSKKSKLQSIQSKLKERAEEKGYAMEQKTKAMKARDKKSACKTFHGAGMVVPIDENEVGYREVPETPADLKKMFKAVSEAKSESDRDKAMDPLMEVLMLIQFANDECDYGEGLEMGLCMFSYGSKVLHGQIMNLLPLAYQLLRRPEYEKIITAHLKDRKSSADLSELN